MQTIKIADTTLKISATRETDYSFREKQEIANLLDKIEISVIELPQLSSNKADSLLVKSVTASVKHSTVSLAAELSDEGIDRAWDALKNARHPRLQICVPVSPVGMEYVCRKKPRKILEMIGELCKKCRSLCDDVEFVAEDATRSEIGFLSDAVTEAVKNGAGRVSVSDTAGTFMPDEFKAFCEQILALPVMKNIPLGISCSDEMNVAAASCIAAAKAGAVEIKTSVLGGNTPSLDSLAQILRQRGEDLGLNTKLSFTQLQRTVKQIRSMTDNRRSVLASGFAPAQSETELLELTLTKDDGIAAVSKAVERLGYDLSDDDKNKVYDSFCTIAAKKDVNIKELEAIVASAALQVPATYSLESYVINTGNVISSTAHIKLIKDGKVCEGICAGDGPIDASFRAIEQITGHHYELDDFQIQSVSEGREAMGSSFIKLRSDGKLYSGKGISTDILGASIRAYINALNKIVYEEN